ncbi:uncharacterized protein LOC111693548 [Trichogramma pretiosum]|uniref:uncharacterized protein LOC111693548 n=1 Tax=Trichogramma pretiosum TaxID=7493 RepID=UPI000C71C798|nr:uncharacterized protein LOC111693548 [Trichogramma pretiosum]
MSSSYHYNFCPQIKDTVSECSSKYANNMQRKECKQFAYCRGKIKSCESLDKNTVVCETSTEKERKYVYAESRGKIEGKKEKSCSGRTYEHQASEYRPGYMGALNRIDSSCLCTCVNPDSNVYINLREAVSDVHKNKVITGIRFRKINDTFHLQIQQAKLLPSAAIDPKTKAWIKVNKTDSDARVGVDYHQLSWDYRSFELDDIEVTKNHVLTGVKFTLDQGLLRLEVRGSQFNYKSGKLRTDKHTWNRHDTPKNQLK